MKTFNTFIEIERKAKQCGPALKRPDRKTPNPGIPNPPKINQRKHRKQMRRVRPHGWKGGAA